MNTVSPIAGYWKALKKTLNDLVNEINKRTPQQGTGISINEGPSGFTISLASVLLPVQAVAGSGLTADQIALLKALANDPGIKGTQTDPTDTSTTPGPVEWHPWKSGATSGWRKITYLEPVTVEGVTSNMLMDVWSWTGTPFNSRICNANVWGG